MKTKKMRYGINGVILDVFDFDESYCSEIVAKELRHNCYRIDTIKFNEGDILLDIGANIGMVSMYAALKHPGIKVYAYEPLSSNYDHLIMGIKENQLEDRVIAIHSAVSGDGKPVNLQVNYHDNSGGGTSNVQDLNLSNHHQEKVDSITLDQIINEKNIEKIKLLKIDCEGSEYDILYNSSLLDRIDNLGIEIHTNQYLKRKGYDPDQLLDYLSKYIQPIRTQFTIIKMAE